MAAKNIPDLQGALVCEDVRQEINPASQTLVGVLSCLQSPQFPVTVLKLFVWVRWCAGRGEFTQKIRILKADESSLVQDSVVKFQLADENASVTNVTLFGGVQFNEPGIYSIEVHIDEQLKLRFPFPVVQVQGQMPTQNN